MIFSFWTASGSCASNWSLAEGIAEWRALCPDYTVFSEEQVAPLLEPYGDEAATLFRRIRIPACKSDVARLVLLHRYGGLYVDAHCAPGAADQVSLVFDWLRRWDIVLFDESAYLPEYRHTWLLNGVFGARAGSDLLDMLIRQAFANLAEHGKRELASPEAHVEYNIYKLTGPWMIWHAFFERTPIGGELKGEYRDRVVIWPFDGASDKQPVRTYKYGGYRTEDALWSRRQLTERLFEDVPAGTTVSTEE